MHCKESPDTNFVHGFPVDDDALHMTSFSISRYPSEFDRSNAFSPGAKYCSSSSTPNSPLKPITKSLEDAVLVPPSIDFDESLRRSDGLSGIVDAFTAVKRGRRDFFLKKT